MRVVKNGQFLSTLFNLIKSDYDPCSYCSPSLNNKKDHLLPGVPPEGILIYQTVKIQLNLS